MAIKKKKASKPAPKKGKPAPKKAAKPAAKHAPKKAGKKAVKKPVPTKAAKKTVSKKTIAKPVAKKAVIAAKKPATSQAPKPPVKPVAPPPKPAKPAAPESNPLVSIKRTPKPVIKKEPPKPLKVVMPKISTRSSVKYEPEFTKSVLDHPMHEQTGPTMRYSDADLAEFREIINKKLDAAKKELAYLQGLITRRDEGGDMDEARYMTMEDGSVSMEREQLSQMASRQITFIDHLEKALMRIENKTYGVCRVTGKLIDKARLRAVPHATLSIEAKQMMNK